jgi:AcrR family transcriptional regulator
MGSERRRDRARKQPRQDRSRHTVAAILDAAAQVFARRGYANTTTNHIAERAGVSIGSLYQYFPSKDAVLVALAERHVEHTFAVILEEVRDTRTAPPAELLRALIDALVRAHQIDPRLHRVLFEEAHLLDAAFRLRLEELDARALQLARDLIDERIHELAIDNAEMASFIVVQVLEGVTHAVVVRHPDMLGKAEFREELVRLLYSYLTAGVAVPDSPHRRHARGEAMSIPSPKTRANGSPRTARRSSDRAPRAAPRREASGRVPRGQTVQSGAGVS